MLQTDQIILQNMTTDILSKLRLNFFLKLQGNKINIRKSYNSSITFWNLTTNFEFVCYFLFTEVDLQTMYLYTTILKGKVYNHDSLLLRSSLRKRYLRALEEFQNEHKKKWGSKESMWKRQKTRSQLKWNV